ncbi:PEP/pyruvate-binding domain-containing protein [Kiloniella sp. EL199]|uniref:PEP/pyruvate-binding domain-containing protein n=1 Tax=Kiloniella sp. EL199 TaxID=2107581 RepID=UPI000EA11C4F|nr:PEP/pyruvate-binding domain-containing protein [Kiloniella sp. EL199]
MSGYILTMEEAFDHGADIVGGKNWGLARLDRYGFKIPKTLALTNALYLELIETAVPDSLLKDLVSRPDDLILIEQAHELLLKSELPEAFIEELETSLSMHDLQHADLAVRSSAVGEDGVSASFAGQHQSILSVRGIDALILAIKQCFASLWTPAAVAYRTRMGFDVLDVTMAITLCKMIGGRTETTAGVAFTVDPVTGRRDIMVVEAVTGLADALVNGQVQGCRYEITRQHLTASAVQNGPLSDRQLELLAEQLSRLHWTMGDGDTAYDTEWVFEGNDLYFVQARPVTATPHLTLPRLASDPVIWSNANFKEVLAEIPCPMSWSVIETAIPEMLYMIPNCTGYQVPSGLHTIKRIKGRCYANLSELQWLWYDGYGQNPDDSNRNLGGHQPAIALPEQEGLFVKLKRIWRGIRVMLLLSGADKKLEEASAAIFERVRSFRKHDLTEWKKEDLTDNLWRWMADTEAFMPDFAKGANYCGIKLFLFEQQVSKLKSEADRKLAYALLSGGGQMDSAEHAISLRAIAEMAENDPKAKDILESNDLPIEVGDGAFETALRDYLDLYGHRGVGELDMRYPRWSESPRFLFEQIKFLMNQGKNVSKRSTVDSDLKQMLDALPARQCRALMGAAKQARAGMALRERVKSAIVALMEPARRLVMEKGRRMARDGSIQAADDLCWITFQEFSALIEGTWNGKGLCELIEIRRQKHDQWAKETVANVYIEEPGQKPVQQVTERLAGTELVGFGAFPGQYQGIARVLSSPDKGQGMMQGDIMVAPFTDPSWTPLFLRAGALVMEIGGTMSHGVIVARELGLPTVVNIPGALEWVQDGELLEVDGSLGRITKKAA